MAYDTYLNRETGDWVFNAHGDFLGVAGDEFDRQRIWIRAKIPRGTFTYDKNGTLGSTLYSITRNPSQRQVDAAIAAMYVALEGITGIQVEDVQAVLNTVGQTISLNVFYSKTADPNDIGAFQFQLPGSLQEGTEFESATT